MIFGTTYSSAVIQNIEEDRILFFLSASKSEMFILNLDE